MSEIIARRSRDGAFTPSPGLKEFLYELIENCVKVGQGIDPKLSSRVIGIEDSSAGIVSLRFARFSAINISGGI